MRICHITTAHENRYDPRIYLKECSSLAKAGYEVILIVNDRFQDEEKNGVKIISLRQTPRNRIDRATRIVSCAYKKALEVDAELYHIHDPELLGVALKLKRKGKKVIFDSHEFTAVQIMTKDYIPNFLRTAISCCYSYREKRILRRLDGLIIPCLFDGKDYFSDVCVTKEIIGNHPIIEGERASTRFNTDGLPEPKACYIGAITESRGILHMVRACALAQKRLVLVGKLENELKRELEIMPEYMYVEYLGELDHEGAMREASKCAVGLCLPQYQGQYPRIDTLFTKQYEYMMLGVPQVMSDFAFFKRTLERYKFGLAVDPSDDSAIAEAINNIVENEPMQIGMAEEGRKAVVTELNWGIESVKLIKFYDKILTQ